MDQKIDAERAYSQKKKEFIVKNKREIEKEKNKANEEYIVVLKNKLKEAKKQKNMLRREFDELGTISRVFEDK